MVLKTLGTQTAKTLKKKPKPQSKGKKKAVDQPAVRPQDTPEGREKLRSFLGLPRGTPVKGYISRSGLAGKSPVLRGVSAQQLFANHSVSELKKMSTSLKSGRMGKIGNLNDTEKASQVKRIEKALSMHARTEADVGPIMKAGQRRFDPNTGEEMFRKGGMVKNRKTPPKRKQTKLLFGFKK